VTGARRGKIRAARNIEGDARAQATEITNGVVANEKQSWGSHVDCVGSEKRLRKGGNSQRPSEEIFMFLGGERIIEENSYDGKETPRKCIDYHRGRYRGGVVGDQGSGKEKVYEGARSRRKKRLLHAIARTPEVTTPRRTAGHIARLMQCDKIRMRTISPSAFRGVPRNGTCIVCALRGGNI